MRYLIIGIAVLGMMGCFGANEDSANTELKGMWVLSQQSGPEDEYLEIKDSTFRVHTQNRTTKIDNPGSLGEIRKSGDSLFLRVAHFEPMGGHPARDCGSEDDDNCEWGIFIHQNTQLKLVYYYPAKLEINPPLVYTKAD